MTTCSVIGCDRPRHQRQKMCGSHFMKWYRYGDPLYRAPRRGENLVGQYFSRLVPIAPASSRRGFWVCECICGGSSLVGAWHLKTGTIKSCGCNQFTERSASYAAVHRRLVKKYGPASSYKCVDCAVPAQQWAYDRQDPAELLADGLSRYPLPYSLDLEHYDPRCTSCHKKFDLTAIGVRTLK